MNTVDITAAHVESLKARLKAAKDEQKAAVTEAKVHAKALAAANKAADAAGKKVGKQAVVISNLTAQLAALNNAMNNADIIAAHIESLKAWCLSNYEHGADVMVECWADEDFRSLLASSTDYADALSTLMGVAAVYRDQRADARNSW
jgi:hypothetical protein